MDTLPITNSNDLNIRLRSLKAADEFLQFIERRAARPGLNEVIVALSFSEPELHLQDLVVVSFDGFRIKEPIEQRLTLNQYMMWINDVLRKVQWKMTSFTVLPPKTEDGEPPMNTHVLIYRRSEAAN
jgi:hypothetical protein